MYGFLLLFYPARFRRRFGDELAQAFQDGWERARRRSPIAAAAYLAAATWDAVSNGLSERRVPAPPEPERSSMFVILQQDLHFSLRMLRRQPAGDVARRNRSLRRFGWCGDPHEVSRIPTLRRGAAAVLAAVALVSSYLPALRASRIHPAVALRGE